MYTADHARAEASHDLDSRIQDAVAGASGNRASLRVYIEDPFCHTIAYELERRGFTVEHVPDIGLKGDVSFSW